MSFTQHFVKWEHGFLFHSFAISVAFNNDFVSITCAKWLGKSTLFRTVSSVSYFIPSKELIKKKENEENVLLLGLKGMSVSNKPRKK